MWMKASSAICEQEWVFHHPESVEDWLNKAQNHPPAKALTGRPQPAFMCGSLVREPPISAVGAVETADSSNRVASIFVVGRLEITKEHLWLT